MFRSVRVPTVLLSLVAPLLIAPLARSAEGIDPYALTLEGRSAGPVHSVSGGYLVPEVPTDPGLATSRATTVQESLSYTDIQIEVGMGMSDDFDGWLEGFGAKDAYRSGKFAQTDYNFENTALEFRGAHISEITFPALDVSRTDPAYLRVGLAAEEVRGVDAPRLAASAPPPRQKKWLASNFTFELDGLPCDRVAKIDSFTVKQGVKPGSVEISNLVVTLPAGDARAWMDWFQRSVTEGGSSAANALDGRITLLAPDHETVLGQVDLLQVGVVSLSMPEPEANEDGSAFVEAELSVEQVKLHFGGE
jgi:hypothetical protein